jgi:hypothetical protein
MSISYAEIEDLRANTDGTDKPQDPYSDASEINAQLAQLGPDDHVRLAAVLRQYPDQSQTILYVAVRQCGNACVQRALSIVQQGEGAPPSQTNRDESGSMGPSVAPATHAPDPEVQEMFRDANSHTTAWNQAAERYNLAHPHFVSEFTAVTDGYGLRDGKIDPEAVSAWQGAHGLMVDGKVGPATVAAAKSEAESKTASASDVASTQDTPDEEVDPSIEAAPRDYTNE